MLLRWQQHGGCFGRFPLQLLPQAHKAPVQPGGVAGGCGQRLQRLACQIVTRGAGQAVEGVAAAEA